MEKVALVTGASAGIGRATAARLAAEGWAVVGASRRGTAPEGCQGLVMDVDEGASVNEAVGRVLAERGRVDALVTCAGWGVAGALELTPVDAAKAQLETNFWGTVRVVQAVLPAMRAAGGGRLVLLSSIGGLIGLPFQAFYSASKFALEGLGEALAYEVAPFGVKVTVIEPGNVRTEFTDRRRVVGAGEGWPVGRAGGPAAGGAAGPAGAGPSIEGYSRAQAKAISVMEQDERNGVAPDKVAAVIVKVLSSSRPPRRVSVGKASERVGLVAKRLMPFWAFEAAARSSLGV
ncbi:MAG: SDR family oxidoreductase [Actinomycetota bacterium]|jgi:NAD(P)-dependent dehydrogenase (short-subunit alcohol dehydrogenase family)|nr:SDR family oxidoreductase [Actinomycetota bacterium]